MQHRNKNKYLPRERFYSKLKSLKESTNENWHMYIVKNSGKLLTKK